MTSLKCSGMQSILNGLIRYRSKLRGQLIKQFEQASDDPHPHGFLLTCVDSRILSSRITQSVPGETFVSRNPGNLVPNYSILDPKTPRPEEAAFELACLWNDIDTIVICGHADCKAMNLVYDNRNNFGQAPKPGESESVLKTWLMSNSGPTIQKFLECEKNNFKTPVKFSITETQNFEAFIDPENNFGPNDKLSQINTLTQMENLKHYKFIKDLLDQNKINTFALWFDIYCGDVYCFSFKEKRFIKLDDESYERLISNLYDRLGINILSNS